MNRLTTLAGLRSWVDVLAPRLIRCAASWLPAGLCDRLEEEWLSDLCARSAGSSRLQFAIGCCWAAMQIGGDDLALNVATCGRATVGGPVTAHVYARARTSSTLRPKAAASNGSVVCDINTTPLIDVMLVLLVTLIMSLPLMTHAVKLDLPQAQPLSAPAPDAISLDIESDGTVLWDGTPVTNLEQLDGYLRAEARKTPQPEIHLRPEPRTRYGVVARVLALAQHDRIQRIGFVGTGVYKD